MPPTVPGKVSSKSSGGGGDPTPTPESPYPLVDTAGMEENPGLLAMTQAYNAGFYPWVKTESGTNPYYVTGLDSMAKSALNGPINYALSGQKLSTDDVRKVWNPLLNN